MILWRFTIWVLFLFCGLNLWSQVASGSTEIHAIYKRVSIDVANKNVLNTLNEIGIDLSCGAIIKNNKLAVELSFHDLETIVSQGIPYTILIEDMTAYYSERAIENLPQARQELSKMKETSLGNGKSVLENIGQYNGCDELDWTVPTEFNLNPNNPPNSFGGCLTHDQIMQELDEMRAQYPNLITTRLDASPTNQTTIEGRTIYYVRISDNPDVDEPNEPETLYQSLIHSREAGAVMQLLYFMWYILENYDTDQDIKNLINNQALYFIPVFNPDGLAYNEVQAPDGGGMQRKNRNIGGPCGTFLNGIDLNRNSAYYWGNGGASTSQCSDTYLGTAPFSENETQIMRDFFLDHDFKLSLNHHSYKNALLHGYAGTVITNPRPDEYAKYSHDMSYYNRYAYGPSTSISSLNSGNMNDWMLGGLAGVSANGTATGTGSGKNTLAWTPENGTFGEGGFWPVPSNYVPIAKRAMRMNFLAAYYSGKYARLHDLNQNEIQTLNGNLTFGIENLGQTSSDFTVSVVAITSNVLSVGNPVVVSGMGVLDQNEASISYALDPSIQPNDTMIFKVTLMDDYATDNVLYEVEVTKVYQPNVIFSDNPDLDGLSNWTASGGGWVATSNAYSGTMAITSTISPPYGNNDSKTLTLNEPVDLSNLDQVLVQYYAKWDLERSFDYVQIEGSIDGITWTPLCGEFTKPGSFDGNNTYSGKSFSDRVFQPDGFPLYDGDTQDKWVMEEVLIDDQTHAFLLNQNTVYFRFNFNTDGSNNQDAYYNSDFEGFTFDDFKCSTNKDQLFANIDELTTHDIIVYPNPINESLSIDINTSLTENEISVFEGNGRLLYNQRQIKNGTLILNSKAWASGIYFVTLNGYETYKVVKL